MEHQPLPVKKYPEIVVLSVVLFFFSTIAIRSNQTALILCTAIPVVLTIVVHLLPQFSPDKSSLRPITLMASVGALLVLAFRLYMLHRG